MIGVFLCFMVFLIPLNEVQIYSRRYARELAYDGVKKEFFKFLFVTWEVSCTKGLVPSATV